MIEPSAVLPCRVQDVPHAWRGVGGGPGYDMALCTVCGMLGIVLTEESGSPRVRERTFEAFFHATAGIRAWLPPETEAQGAPATITPETCSCGHQPDDHLVGAFGYGGRCNVEGCGCIAFTSPRRARGPLVVVASDDPETVVIRDTRQRLVDGPVQYKLTHQQVRVFVNDLIMAMK